MQAEIASISRAATLLQAFFNRKPTSHLFHFFEATPQFSYTPYQYPLANSKGYPIGIHRLSIRTTPLSARRLLLEASDHSFAKPPQNRPRQ